MKIFVRSRLLPNSCARPVHRPLIINQIFPLAMRWHTSIAIEAHFGAVLRRLDDYESTLLESALRSRLSKCRISRGHCARMLSTLLRARVKLFSVNARYRRIWRLVCVCFVCVCV